MGYLRKSEAIGATADDLLLNFLVVVVVFGVVRSSDDVASGCYGNDTGHPVCFSAYRDRGIALRSWSDALELCRGTFGGSLPVVSSTRVQLRLTEFLYDKQFTIDSVWLGARGTTWSPTTANADWRWISGGAGGGGAFPSSDVLRSDSSFDRSMAVVSVDASGNASIGAETMAFTADGFICQSKQQTTCLGDAADDHFGDGVNCFRRFDQAGNWFTSRNRCLYGNGDLATLHNTTTAGLNEVLGKLGLNSDKMKGKYYWVGLTKLWWQWAPDSVEYNLTFFMDRPSVENSSVASGNCLAVDFRNQFSWTIRDCSIKLQTVCQTSELTMTTPSSSSSVTLPVWAVGVIAGCVGLFYILSLVVVALIVCKCCGGRRKTTNDRRREERIQQNRYHIEPVRQVTNSVYPPQMPPPDNPPLPRRQSIDVYEEFDDDDDEGEYDDEIPAAAAPTATPPGDQYMNHEQATRAAQQGTRRPR